MTTTRERLEAVLDEMRGVFARMDADAVAMDAPNWLARAFLLRPAAHVAQDQLIRRE